MRIAFIYHFDDSAWAGGRNYFSSLFDALHGLGERIGLVLLAGQRTRTTLPDDHPYLEVVRTPLLDRRHPAWFLRQALRALAGRRHDPLIGGLLRKLRVDVLSHSQPLRARGSCVKVLGWIPDFQFMHLPHLWTGAEIERMREVLGETCRDSDALVVSSQDALKDLRSFMPGYTKPVHVLHFAPNTATLAKLGSADELRQRYQLPADYFFLPNQFWVHKNHRLVVDALIELQRLGSDVTVVCSGKPGDPRQPGHFDALIAHAAAHGVADRFKVLGMIPYADMQGLMKHCLAVINPSRFEGWSTTVEEAKAMGQRVLLSDIPVHREQDPPGAIYFGVDDAGALARALLASAAQPRAAVDEAALAARQAQAQRDFGRRYLQIVDSLA